MRQPKWRVLLDRDLEARWVVCLSSEPLPDEVRAMLEELRAAMDKRPVVLGPDFEVEVQI